MKEMRNKIIQNLLMAFILFAVLFTLFTIGGVVFSGKIVIRPIDLIMNGVIATVYFFILRIKERNRKKKEMLHGSGESWKD